MSQVPAPAATSTIRMTFREEPLYAGAVSNVSNAAWESLIPSESGPLTHE